ncbi:MAG: M48 family metallopeptidase [Magnetovibrio sp.]|nr:M48 family metallopeptidase [Magnetovibrio sp.]
MSERKTSTSRTIDIDGQSVSVEIRRHPQARRMILRLDEAGTGAVVTIPKYVAFKDGVEMAQRKASWIKHQLAKKPEVIEFADGAEVPLLGEPYTIVHHPQGQGVAVKDGEIRIAGRPEHLRRRMTDWFKSQARKEISVRVHAKAGEIERRVERISIRDTRSRWGSCGIGGTLNFSWRLILAPEHVLDYVVAHEVAHLVHHNHSDWFWALTDRLCDRMTESRDWLNAFGHDLHRYG